MFTGLSTSAFIRAAKAMLEREEVRKAQTRARRLAEATQRAVEKWNEEVERQKQEKGKCSTTTITHKDVSTNASHEPFPK
jgi:short-subunit dehydrogenase